VAPFRAGLTLAALLAEIGPTDTADLHRVHITDALGKDLLVDAAAPGDILLRPGDTITVPVGVGSDQVTVLGGVNKAGTMPFHDGLTVADALAASGGLSAHADATKISIQRNGDSMPATSETVLLRGDVLRIGVSVDLEYVSVKGAVVNPGVVEWRKGMRLSDAITAAGGPKDRANLTRVELLPFGSTKRVRYDLLAIRSGAKPDPEIQPNDTIVVPVGRGHG
jgi:protein involved in polysaccharide export with SLBB domain